MRWAPVIYCRELVASTGFGFTAVKCLKTEGRELQGLMLRTCLTSLEDAGCQLSTLLRHGRLRQAFIGHL